VKRVAALTAVLSMTLPTAQILAQNTAAIGGSGGISTTRPLPAQNVKPSLDWSRISKLPPGTVIIIGWPASTVTKLDVLSANDDELIGLDLSDSALPAQAAKQLRKAARVHADYFLRAPPGTILVFDNEFYLKSSEIFLDGQKVADLHQILRRIPRADVERDATTLTILPVPKGMSMAAKICIGVAVAIAAFGVIVWHLVPET
jgi:hypothetical protein